MLNYTIILFMCHDEISMNRQNFDELIKISMIW